MTNKISVVTGCNRGIGEGIKNSLLEDGYQVFGLNRTPAEETPGYLEIACDMASQESIKSAAERILYLTDKVDVLVHNAAIRRFGTVEDLSIDDWVASVNINLTGVFYLTQQLLPILKDTQGYCLFVGSHSEKYTFAEGAAYCSTKAALRAFSECLLEEVRHDGVKVSYLSIGAVKNRDHGYEESWKLTPEDIGGFIVDLLNMPRRALSSYVDIRPTMPKRQEIGGIEALQYV